MPVDVEPWEFSADPIPEEEVTFSTPIQRTEIEPIKSSVGWPAECSGAGDLDIDPDKAYYHRSRVEQEGEIEFGRWRSRLRTGCHHSR